MNVNDRAIKATLKDPNFDIIQELSFETRVLHVSPLSYQTTVPQIKEIFEKYGKIKSIKKYATKCFVELENSDVAKAAYTDLHEKRVDGLIWKIHPARKYDSEKERDFPDRNICFSKNFLDEADQQILLKFAFHGSKPDISDDVMNNANNVIEQAKMVQQAQLDQAKSQLEGVKSFSAMQNQMGGQMAQGAKGMKNDPISMMNMMSMMMQMQGGGGSQNMNPMMSMMGSNMMTGMTTPGSMQGGSQTPQMPAQANNNPVQPTMNNAQTTQVTNANTNQNTNLNTGNQTP